MDKLPFLTSISLAALTALHDNPLTFNSDTQTRNSSCLSQLIEVSCFIISTNLFQTIPSRSKAGTSCCVCAALWAFPAHLTFPGSSLPRPAGRTRRTSHRLSRLFASVMALWPSSECPRWSKTQIHSQSLRNASGLHQLCILNAPLCSFFFAETASMSWLVLRKPEQSEQTTHHLHSVPALPCDTDPVFS